jgi:hypothetical protein
MLGTKFKLMCSLKSPLVPSTMDLHCDPFISKSELSLNKIYLHRVLWLSAVYMISRGLSDIQWLGLRRFFKPPFVSCVYALDFAA